MDRGLTGKMTFSNDWPKDYSSASLVKHKNLAAIGITPPTRKLANPACLHRQRMTTYRTYQFPMTCRV